jgi:hypothetical protein
MQVGYGGERYGGDGVHYLHVSAERASGGQRFGGGIGGEVSEFAGFPLTHKM